MDYYDIRDTLYTFLISYLDKLTPPLNVKVGNLNVKKYFVSTQICICFTYATERKTNFNSEKIKTKLIN